MGNAHGCRQDKITLVDTDLTHQHSEQARLAAAILANQADLFTVVNILGCRFKQQPGTTTQSDVLHLYHGAKCNKQNILIRLSVIAVLRNRETGQDESRIGGQNADRMEIMNRSEIVWKPDYRNRCDFFEFRGEKPLRGIFDVCSKKRRSSHFRAMRPEVKAFDVDEGVQ